MTVPSTYLNEDVDSPWNGGRWCTAARYIAGRDGGRCDAAWERGIEHGTPPLSIDPGTHADRAADIINPAR